MFNVIHTFIIDFETNQTAKSACYRELQKIDKDTSLPTPQDKTLVLIEHMSNLNWPVTPNPPTYWKALKALINDEMRMFTETLLSNSALKPFISDTYIPSVNNETLNINDRLRYFKVLYTEYLEHAVRGLIPDSPLKICTHPCLRKDIETVITGSPLREDQYRCQQLTYDLNRSWVIRFKGDPRKYKATDPDTFGITKLTNMEEDSDIIEINKDPPLICIIQNIIAQQITIKKELPYDLYSLYVKIQELMERYSLVSGNTEMQIILFHDNPYKAEIFFSRQSFTYNDLGHDREQESQLWVSADEIPLFEFCYTLTIGSSDYGNSYSADLTQCDYRDATPDERFHRVITEKTQQAISAAEQSSSSRFRFMSRRTRRKAKKPADQSEAFELQTIKGSDTSSGHEPDANGGAPALTQS